MTMGSTAPHSFNNLNTISERKQMDHSSQSASLLSLGRLDLSASHESDALPSIVIRKLPRTAHIDVVRTMLLFSKDLSYVSLTDSDLPEDKGHMTAVARFMSLAGANEAREKLDGKTMGDSLPLVVELHGGAATAGAGRRNTVDGLGMRHGASSSSSIASSNGVRQSSRFNGTFQSLEKLSPPSGMDSLPAPESNNASIQNLFSPQSPLTNSNVSKSIINNDPDDETGKLLSDAVAFSKGSDAHQSSMSRRMGVPQMPISRFAGLSLSTNNSGQGLTSPSMNGMLSPRSLGPSQSPNPAMSPNTMQPLPGLGPSPSYPMQPQHYHRPNYPPVNPADQNPPCNTLYVGNLPMDTSEDELKAIFSKQRGYKRLCFRTKANGPMCFVEFEDTSFATKALNELYGQPLHNSVKGGIRLSFSKNPLGVRSGQNTNNHNNMNPHGPIGTSNSSIGPGGFTTATGPPPGLSAPPGFSAPPMSGNQGLGLYNSGPFGMGGTGFGGSMRQPLANGVPSSMAGGGYPGMGGDYGNYMGR
jgi:hypothetical protein